MCLYPKLIINKKYTSTKKNEGRPPPITDIRTKYVPIGCQNCIECRKQRARAWQVRLLEDIKTHTNGKFITLTFNNDAIKDIYEEILIYNDYNGLENLTGYELDNQIATWATRRFLERWRKKYKKTLRHWLVTELGHNGTENIHIHGIIWTDEKLTEVENTWKYGYMWKGKPIVKKKNKIAYANYVNETTVNYIIKYVNKQDEIHTQYKAKVLTSPGIGHNYTQTTDSKKNTFREKKTIETYRTRTGHKIAMPIYWRNKIYTEKQKEVLWTQRLDKEERWICGEKVSIKNNYDAYDNLIKWYREKNTKLGYGKDEQDQAKQEYEKQRRIIMIQTRIQNTTHARNKSAMPHKHEIYGTPSNRGTEDIIPCQHTIQIQ